MMSIHLENFMIMRNLDPVPLRKMLDNAVGNKKLAKPSMYVLN